MSTETAEPAVTQEPRDTWLKRALKRRQDEDQEVDQAAAVAKFNSSL